MSLTLYPSDKTFLAGLSLLKTAGQTSPGPALSTQINMPILSANPTNPFNFAYLPVSNAAGATINAVQGKRTPMFVTTLPMKLSWATSVHLNDLLAGTPSCLDANVNSSEYAVCLGSFTAPSGGLYDPIPGRIFTGCKCMGLEIVYVAAAGSVNMTMLWLPIYPDNEDPLLTATVGADGLTRYNTNSGSFGAAFTAYAKDPGLFYGTKDVVITGPAQVDGFTLSLVRAQALQQWSTGTLYAGANTTGMIGGTLRVLQGRAGWFYANASSFSVQIGPGSGGGGIVIAPVLNVDTVTTPWGTGRSVTTTDTSMVDLTGTTNAGGYPFTITAA